MELIGPARKLWGPKLPKTCLEKRTKKLAP